MRLTFREALRADVPRILALLSDDMLGAARELDDPGLYLEAFDRIQAEGNQHVIVGESPDGEIVATYQLTFISGLSLAAARRAQIESVRVASHLRGQGIGAAMIADAEMRARAAGCSLLQLTMDARRTDAHRFYLREGFVPSHTGFKRSLD